MSISIAIAGKGGVGKTTFSALLVRVLLDAGIRPMLAVDADPNSNLAEALGVESGLALAEIREEVSTPEGSPASGIGRVRHLADKMHMEAIVEAEGFDLITMGRPEGPGCYCYVNSLLRKSLDDLKSGYKAVVIDNEAGLEHLSRRTTNDVDVLVAVMTPTVPALRAVRRMLDLSRKLPVSIGRRAVLVIQVRPEGVSDDIEREIGELDAERLPDIPMDETVERAGTEGRDVFALDADTPALRAVRHIVDIVRDIGLQTGDRRKSK